MSYELNAGICISKAQNIMDINIKLFQKYFFDISILRKIILLQSQFIYTIKLYLYTNYIVLTEIL